MIGLRDRRPRLLIVDDEPSILMLVRRFAESRDFEVITHAGGHSLLAELATLKPDAALLDRHMPEVGGLDVLRVIRDIDSQCQVILMTGDATVESAIQAVKLGASEYESV